MGTLNKCQPKIETNNDHTLLSWRRMAEGLILCITGRRHTPTDSVLGIWVLALQLAIIPFFGSWV